MLKKRLIACLLVRDDLMVQSIGFEKYLPIGNPKFPIEFVAKWDVDEIVLLDMSATPKGLGPNRAAIELLSQSCFVPLTVGGGIQSVDDVRNVIRAGADKACLNTHAFNRPQLISEIADSFGCQCVVISMDCKRVGPSDYRVFLNSGKVDGKISPEEWALKAESFGAGEIFLNSIDRDGSREGYDIELIQRVSSAVKIPVIACGGVGNYHHFSPGILKGGASAVAAANIFHHIEHSTILAKAHLLQDGIDVRLDSNARYAGREFDEEGRLLMLSNERLLDLELLRSKTH